jgi:fumigallin biosynthesis monooxygenase-like protein
MLGRREALRVIGRVSRECEASMAQINKRRVTADVEGDFVVFVIGARINKLWKVHKWLPVVLAMPRMLKELEKNPDSGFLGAEGLGIGNLVQYWRSFEHLERYARQQDAEHWPAWVAFNKKVASNGDVGIWHETYLVRAGEYECVYNNMPAFGLAKVTETVDADGENRTASGRLGRDPAAAGASGDPD